MAHSTDLREKTLDYYEQCKNASQTQKCLAFHGQAFTYELTYKEQTGSSAHQVKGSNAAKADTRKILRYYNRTASGRLFV